MGMERHDYILLATTATCAALAIASFVIMPYPSRRFLFPIELLQFVTMSIGCQLLVCITTIPIHICTLRKALPPDELFSYRTVLVHWVFTACSLAFASAGLSILYGEQFLHSCGGSSGAVCRIRCEISSWLALVTAALGIVHTLVLHCATRRTHCAAQTV